MCSANLCLPHKGNIHSRGGSSYYAGPTQTRSLPTQMARVIPMIPTYTTSVGLPKICLAYPNEYS